MCCHCFCCTSASAHDAFGFIPHFDMHSHFISNLFHRLLVCNAFLICLFRSWPPSPLPNIYINTCSINGTETSECREKESDRQIHTHYNSRIQAKCQKSVKERNAPFFPPILDYCALLFVRLRCLSSLTNKKHAIPDGGTTTAYSLFLPSFFPSMSFSFIAIHFLIS